MVAARYVAMAMARQVAAGVHLLVVLLTARCCAGRDFDVGGRDGWRASPAEPFNRWAERNRFQVNDSLGEYTSMHPMRAPFALRSIVSVCRGALTPRALR